MYIRQISKITFTLFVGIALLISNDVALASLTDGLVAHYAFEGNADDKSGNGYNGTENGGISYHSGLLGISADFDGIDDYIDVSVPLTHLFE